MAHATPRRPVDPWVDCCPQRCSQAVGQPLEGGAHRVQHIRVLVRRRQQGPQGVTAQPPRWPKRSLAFGTRR